MVSTRREVEKRAVKDWDGNPGVGEIQGNLLLNI